jgi:hypothetical protein
MCSGEVKLDGSGVPVVSIDSPEQESSYPADLEITTIKFKKPSGPGLGGRGRTRQGQRVPLHPATPGNPATRTDT